jgi:ssDNA-binding Zn-finger/Zn-ribbon topoisomerase 1
MPEIWDQFDTPGLKPLDCPECDGLLVLRESRYGPFYGCTRYPSCTAAHGAHKATGEPLGIPANKETKRLRMRAHDLFDEFWKGGRMSRGRAYQWLQAYMEMTEGQAHIGRFTKEECLKLIQALELRKNFRKDRLDNATGGA